MGKLIKGDFRTARSKSIDNFKEFERALERERASRFWYLAGCVTAIICLIGLATVLPAWIVEIW